MRVLSVRRSQPSASAGLRGSRPEPLGSGVRHGEIPGAPPPVPSCASRARPVSATVYQAHRVYLCRRGAASHRRGGSLPSGAGQTRLTRVSDAGQASPRSSRSGWVGCPESAGTVVPTLPPSAFNRREAGPSTAGRLVSVADPGQARHLGMPSRLGCTAP